MLKTIVGILSIIIGLWLLGTTIRFFPIGTYRRGYWHPSTWNDVCIGVLNVVILCGVGIALVLGASWWWILYGAWFFVFVMVINVGFRPHWFWWLVLAILSALGLWSLLW